MPGTSSRSTRTAAPPWPSAAQDPDARALAGVAHLAPDDPVRRRVRDQVVCANLPLARRLAARFAGRGEPTDDLVQVATIGLIRAADRFDASHGVSFAGFAGPTVLGELRHHFRDTRWQVRVDRRLQELYLETVQTSDALVQELGRQPRHREIAERMGVEPQLVRDGMAAGYAFQPYSLDAPLDRADGGSPLAERLGGQDPQLDTAADRFALRQIIGELPEQEQLVLSLRFSGNLTQAEIGARLGVSQMQVCRILTAVLAKLRVALLAEE